VIVNCLFWKATCSVYYYSVVYSIDTIKRNNKGVIPLVIELCPSKQTIQSYWQHWAYKNHDENKLNIKTQHGK
jgi:hypothetical protein